MPLLAQWANMLDENVVDSFYNINRDGLTFQALGRPTMKIWALPEAMATGFIFFGLTSHVGCFDVVQLCSAIINL